MNLGATEVRFDKIKFFSAVSSKNGLLFRNMPISLHLVFNMASWVLDLDLNL